jgi:hypothetical protein
MAHGMVLAKSVLLDLRDATDAFQKRIIRRFHGNTG